MIKLNNKGWGLGIFLTFIAVFFIAIMIIVYISNKYNIGIQNTVVDKNIIEDNNVEEEIEPPMNKYEEYESKIKEKAIEYQEKNYPNLKDGETFMVNLQKLGVTDEIQNECVGYASIKKEDNIFYYDAYISCPGYRTDGYYEK